MSADANKQGFTLIEIALALLVASIGLMGILGLFPAGLQMSKMASDETQAALFAETVLNGVRAQAATSRWDRIRNGIDLPAPTPDVWNDPNTLRIRPTTGSDFATLHYETPGSMAGGGTGYRDFSIRYRLQIVDIDSKRKAVYLDVMPGEFGNAFTNEFYMELYNHGQQ